MSLLQDDYIPLSALQHYMFCPRQCALIHSDQEWRENALTTMGRIEHKRIDSGGESRVGNTLSARSVRVFCCRLKIQGISDVVEYHYKDGSNEIDHLFPIEYKRGGETNKLADNVQLCAQVLCLEEMYAIHIEQAYLYYHRTRRRHAISIDAALRNLTEESITKTRSLLHSPKLPPAQRQPECKACSLESECLPTKSTQCASSYTKSIFDHQTLE